MESGLLFLCSLAVCKDALSLTSGMCMGSWPPCTFPHNGKGVGEAHGIMEVTLSHWGNLLAKHPQCLEDQFLDGVHEAVSRSASLPAGFPAASHSSVVQLTWRFRTGWERSESLCQHFTQLGKPVSQVHIHLPPQWKLQAETGFSWHWAVAYWGGSDVGKVNLSFLSSLIYPALDFFFSNSVLVLLCWIPRPPQGTHVCEWLWKSVFLVGKTIENSSSAILMMSLS